MNARSKIRMRRRGFIGVNRFMRTVCVAILSVSLFVFPGEQQAEAACPPVTGIVSFYDRETQNSVSSDSDDVGTGWINFVTANGNSLFGDGAKIQRSGRRVYATFRNDGLTLIVRADLRRGSVQATAVTREPYVNPPRVPRNPNNPYRPPTSKKPDPGRKTYTISVLYGPSQEVECVLDRRT